MDCGCGGSSFSAENAPNATDPFYWNGAPAEAPASEAAKAEKAPAAAKASTKKADA